MMNLVYFAMLWFALSHLVPHDNFQGSYLSINSLKIRSTLKNLGKPFNLLKIKHSLKNP